jgi:hypothetical protein
LHLVALLGVNKNFKKLKKLLSSFGTLIKKKGVVNVIWLHGNDYGKSNKSICNKELHLFTSCRKNLQQGLTKSKPSPSKHEVQEPTKKVLKEVRGHKQTSQKTSNITNH